MALLDVVDVTVRFGGNLALDNVSVSAVEGRVTGLIGPNGAGKTTLFNVVGGLQPPTHGQVFIDNENVTSLAPYQRARRGLARTFQRLELFGLLTVRENIKVAADIRRGWDRRGQKHAESPAVIADRILSEIGLTEVANERADVLPTGTARLVELGRALATRPRLLLLDEPASGQDESETRRFAVVLRELASAGIGVVLVEHDVRLVMDVCDTIFVLDYGQVLASGAPKDIRSD
ncbi:MAG TPA: ABC transporter ATP-binding protein, partial [Acidimicrobiales bacterium]|nr:ABC transporter ATP-binding protein [Acidimicrobiales bacterium]